VVREVLADVAFAFLVFVLEVEELLIEFDNWAFEQGGFEGGLLVWVVFPG